MNTERENESLNKHDKKSPENIFRWGFEWRPVITLSYTSYCLIVFGCILLAIGIALLEYSRKIKEFSIRYDNINECDDALNSSDENNKTCILKINLKEKFTNPVMVYYELHNFYQNHRRYVRSRSIAQLKGKDLSVKEVKSDCDPVLRNKDLTDYYKNFSWGNYELDPEAVANPCGLIARSFFNDVYNLTTSDNDPIIISKKGIAWPSDKKRFKRHKDSLKIQWIDVEREDFMIWMRPAGLPNFRKLYGKIEKDLEPGTYYVVIKNNYQVHSFNGEKHFVLSTVNGLGGKNNFLGTIYIVSGGVSILASIVFYVKFRIDEKRKSIKND